jgi:hypothetical protein
VNDNFVFQKYSREELIGQDHRSWNQVVTQGIYSWIVDNYW